MQPTPEAILAGLVLSVLLSILAVVISVFRRRSVVTMNLQAELDLAVEQNKRLTRELSDTQTALHGAKLKVSPELLQRYAAMACDYAEKLGGTGAEKRSHAVGAVARFDAEDNGQRDWTDAQARIAVEAHLAARKE